MGRAMCLPTKAKFGGKRISEPQGISGGSKEEATVLSIPEASPQIQQDPRAACTQPRGGQRNYLPAVCEGGPRPCMELEPQSVWSLRARWRRGWHGTV